MVPYEQSVRVGGDVDTAVQERIARNESIFRSANEDIEKKAAAYDFAGQLLPFICECGKEDCTEILQVTIEEYEQVRAEPRQFLNARGHHVNALGVGTVVAANDRFEIVEKQDVAGDVAEQLDPRS